MDHPSRAEPQDALHPDDPVRDPHGASPFIGAFDGVFRSELRRDHALAFIRAARVRGLTLGEIRSVVAFRDRGETRAAEIERRIAELQRLRADLARLATRARLLDPGDCDPAAICHTVATPAG